jgi:formimidoylglutamase
MEHPSRWTDLLQKPDNRLFFKANDPLDLRLGQLVTDDLAVFDESRFILLGCSQDQGVKRNNGRPGAERAPSAIKNSLYRLTAPYGLEGNRLLDIGDSAWEAPLEKIHDRHFTIVKRLLVSNKTVIVLGGGNDISYPDVSAVQAVIPGSLTINIDAHLDIRSNPVRNSGTPYRQLIEEKTIAPATFYELGYQSHANTQRYLQDAEAFGINLVSYSYIRTRSLTKILEETFNPVQGQPLFLGFDMDAIRSADAPGVSASSPIGLTAEQALEIVDFFTENHPVRLFEISEVNPSFDIDGRTAKLAAILIHRFLERTINRSQKKGV